MTAPALPAFMSIGLSEMVVVTVVALLVFGGRLPEVMHNLGKAYANFRRSMNEYTKPIRREIRDLDLRSAARHPPERTPPPAAAAPPPYTLPHDEAPASRGEEAEKPAGRHAPPSGGGGAADEPPPV